MTAFFTRSTVAPREGETAMARKPLVAVIMGSDSDLEVMQECLDTLRRFEIPWEARVFSAHRSPDALREYVRFADGQKVRIWIAAAGGAAHLAGAVAALTTRPVIGVPVAAGPLGGLDALLSTVQMPPGVPVATVAIGKSGAHNAAVLAAQILGLSEARIEAALRAHKKELARRVMEQDAKFRQTIRPRK